MQDDLVKKVEENAAKIEQIYKSVRRTERYFLWTLIATVAFFVLPLIGLLIVIPQFIDQYTTMYSGFLGS